MSTSGKNLSAFPVENLMEKVQPSGFIETKEMQEYALVNKICMRKGQPSVNSVNTKCNMRNK